MKTYIIKRAVAATLGLTTWLLLPQSAHCFYNPSVGRWISRDPAKEQGGASLHCFIANDPVNREDMLGLYELYSEGFAFRNPTYPPWSLGSQSGSGYQNSSTADYDGWASPRDTGICNSGVLRVGPGGDYPPYRTSFVKAYLMTQCDTRFRIICQATIRASVWGRLFTGPPAYNAVGTVLGETINSTETITYPLSADGSDYGVSFRKTVAKDVTLPRWWTYVLYDIHMPIDAQVKRDYKGGFTEQGEASCSIQVLRSTPARP
jgi:hypothetical protein